MKTVRDINSAILSGNWSNEDLRSIFQAVQYKNKENMSRATRSFRVGDKVSFKSKNGQIVKGTITKINQKTVSLTSFEGMQWRVSGSLLSLRD